MATITPKENYLMIARGEIPEYIPNYTMGGIIGTVDEETPLLMAGPMGLNEGGGMGFGAPMDGPPPTEWVDEWGVPYVSNPETGFAGLPKPGAFILEDVTKWDKAIKAPKLRMPLNEFDWEAMAKEGTKHINRDLTGVCSFAGGGVFQQLMGFMGFSEGLCALIEEPEACEELFSYILDYYEPIVEKTLDYYKPDVLMMGDDSASKYDTFMSMDVYRRLFKPAYQRVARHAKDRGIPIEFHNCGRCEAQIGDLIDIGVKYWDPAQTSNDLLAVKEKYKGQITIVGGFDFVPPPVEIPVTEEMVKSYVRETFDKFAPGGMYAFCGGVLGRSDNMEEANKINAWITDEVKSYGHSFYKK
jgi:hypothetical protein